ncbi:hypothetical protein ScPMuIL_012884 [Solemya velum]
MEDSDNSNRIIPGSVVKKPIRMRLIIAVFLFVTILNITTAYWIYDNDESADVYDENAALENLQTVKRYRNMPKCMGWGNQCYSQNTKYSFLQCCSGYVCSCTLWKTHCKCRSRLG